jgi:hypothetical protein
MSPDKQNQLIQKYPKLFEHYQYLECDDGWFDLLDRLCWKIENRFTGFEDLEEGGIYFVQIKEKFGSARIYCNQTTEYVNGLITMAESISGTICEICGEKGQPRKGGWIKTLCDQHHLENQKAKK